MFASSLTPRFIIKVALFELFQHGLVFVRRDGDIPAGLAAKAFGADVAGVDGFGPGPRGAELDVLNAARRLALATNSNWLPRHYRWLDHQWQA